MKKHTSAGIAAVLVLALSACTAPAAPAPASPEPASPIPSLNLPVSMAAIGDSISQAAQADGTPGNQPANSWATGQGELVESLAARISAASESSVSVTNVAVSGAVSTDLVDQAALAVASGAQFVTVLAGGNDICASKSVAELPTSAEYADSVRAALTVLSTGLPETKILVGSIPSLDGIFTAGRGDPAAKRAWADYGICPVALANPDSLDIADVERRAAVEARVTEMNAAVAGVAGEFDNVLFDGGQAQKVDFELSDLSPFDFFHPSIDGQNLLAATEWEVITEAGLFEETSR